MVYRITARNNRSGKVWAHELECLDPDKAIRQHEISCPGWVVVRCERMNRKKAPAMFGWKVHTEPRWAADSDYSSEDVPIAAVVA